MSEKEAIIQAGIQVGDTLSTDGWINHIAPLLDKMIVDVLGGKQGDRWISAPHGIGEEKISVDYLRFLLGYKAAVIDVHSRILKFIDDKNEVLEAEHSQPKVYTSDYEPEK